MPHLTPFERDLLGELHVQKFSQTEIARQIGRSISCVSRELRRNGSSDGTYRPCEAQRRAEERRRNRPYTPKVERPEINAAVRRGLARKHSPDQVAQRIKLEHAHDRGRCVSGMSIYRWIARCAERDYWRSLLRRGGKSPRKPRENKPHSHAAKIADRPDEIERRERLGDFEGDTVLGKQGSGGVVTLVDRKSRYVSGCKIIDKRATTLSRVVRRELLSHVGPKTLSITFDNGTEFASMPRLGERLEAAIYYADPGKPYQRGTNENLNRLLRQYFPKGTDFSQVSHQEVRDALNELNNRPRRCLGYRTPREVFFGIEERLYCV
jgi:transposase, IS30 family